MKRGYFYIVTFALVLILSISSVIAADLEPLREQLLKYGPSLYITNVHTHPEEIQPGSEAIVSIQIENVAPHQLRDIIMNLELPSQFVTGDFSKKKIRTLEGLAKSEINFTIVPLPSSKEGIYKVPLSITYLDEIGNSYSENNTIGLKIYSKPKIFVEISSSDIYSGNLLGNIDIRIANTGISDIKFLVIELATSEDYEVIGSNKNYVGAISSDDYETIDFKLRANSAAKEINLKLNLDYSDSNNNDYKEVITLPFKLVSAKDVGIKQSNNNSIILFIIGILVAYIAYKQIKKRLKKK